MHQVQAPSIADRRGGESPWARDGRALGRGPANLPSRHSLRHTAAPAAFRPMHTWGRSASAAPIRRVERGRVTDQVCAHRSDHTSGMTLICAGCALTRLGSANLVRRRSQDDRWVTGRLGSQDG